MNNYLFSFVGNKLKYMLKLNKAFCIRKRDSMKKLEELLDEEAQKYNEKKTIYETIEHLTKLYDKKRKDINTDNYFLSKIFDISVYLKKKEMQDYIKALKKNRIYKYKNNKVNRFFLKYFTKLYLDVYFYKYLEESGYTYFYGKNKLLMNKKIQYYLGALKRKEKFKYITGKKVYMDYSELVITTKCSLKCKNCANLISMYEKPYDVEEKIIEKTIKKYFESVDYVSLFRILGGEPFCNQRLKEYLKLIDYSKTGKVEIVTNGTIVPKDKELYKIIKKNNIRITISNYGKYSINIDKLISELKIKKIEYVVKNSNEYWYDYGAVIKYNKSKKELQAQFKNCDNRCKSILNGVMYNCPRYSHGYDLKLIKRIPGEYIDLIKLEKKEIKKEILKMMKNNKEIEACKYCLYGTKYCKKIKAAIQK